MNKPTSAYKKAIKIVKAQAKKLGKSPTQSECAENLRANGCHYHAHKIEHSDPWDYNDFLEEEIYR